jgi:hypothetical protein
MTFYHIVFVLGLTWGFVVMYRAHEIIAGDLQRVLDLLPAWPWLGLVKGGVLYTALFGLPFIIGAGFVAILGGNFRELFPID